MTYEHLPQVHYRVENELQKFVCALLPADAEVKAVRAKGDSTTENGGTIVAFVYCDPTLDEEGFRIMHAGLKHRFDCYRGVFHYIQRRRFALYFGRSALEQRVLCTGQSTEHGHSFVDEMIEQIVNEIDPEAHNVPGRRK